MDLCRLTIHEAHALLKKKEINSRELTESVLDRIGAVEDRVGAYITVMKDQALAHADMADEHIKNGDCMPLTGIPIAIKDIICTKGILTTCASRILKGFIPPYDSTVVQKLKAAHAVIVGKTNLDEFGMGSSTENSAMKITRNPWDLERIPGGSSGGSAAAIASDMCIGALGSDTGGSIRQPSSHCGVVGLKPTYGRVSRFGLVAFASSLDQIGPIAKDVTDAALLLHVISGHDPKDSTSVSMEVPDYTQVLETGLKGVTVGIPTGYHKEGVDPDVVDAVRKAVKVIENSGATYREVILPHMEYSVAVYYLIAPAEASSNLARYDGVKYGFRSQSSGELIEMYRNTRSTGFGPEVQRRIILGTYALSAGYYDAYYRKASQVRTLIVEDYKKAFETCDVLIMPVAPTPAFRLGEKLEDPLTMYLSDVFTISANLAGIPGISVPCGFSRKRLPIGLQILANHFNEATLLKVAYNFEQATDYHTRRPEL